jgi:hypothetical protein
MSRTSSSYSGARVVRRAAGVAALAAALLVGAASSAVAAPTPMVDLGTASTYAVLSGASVGNTVSAVGAPHTTLRGDLGVKANTDPTGFPPGVVTGTQNVGNTAASNAHADLVAAYTEVAARPNGVPLAGALAGVTVGPGLYTVTGAVSNTTTFTLNGGGNPNAVFVFQVSGALAMAAGSHVVLANGARASRVFWQVNGAGAVGAGSSFAGTLMALDAVAMGNGTMVNGRAFARNGALTLDANEFYSSPPAVTIAGGDTATTTDTTPTISGTTNVDAVVTVTVNGQTITDTPSGGVWSIDSPLLANATYPVVASVTDGAGNVGSATQQLTVDTVLPLVAINGGQTATTNDATPTLSGTSDVAAGTSVHVAIGSQNRTALVQADGTWAVTAATLLEGTHPVIASVNDPAGNEATDSQDLTVDTLPPGVTITGGANALTNDPAPTISGTADVASGTTVTVDLADETLTAQVASGTWSVTASGLSDGPHRISMSVADAAGNEAGASQRLTVDTVLPVITVDGGAIASTNDPTPTITGTTDVAPGTTVRVAVGQQSRTALVQDDQTWDTTATTLTDGPRNVTAAVSDPAGNEGTDTQDLTVDTIAAAITIAGGATANTTDWTPTISGTTDVDAPGIVSVTINGQTLTATPSGGAWSVDPAILANGSYPVVASITDAGGNPGTAAQQLTVNRPLPGITIDGGATATTDDPTPTITGTTDVAPGTTVHVAVGAQSRTALVQADQSWDVTATALSDGNRTVTATVADPAGNEGTDTQSLTIESSSDVVAIHGGPDALTNDSTPTISGTTDIGSGLVTVTIDSQTLTATPSDGAWSVDAASVADGAHPVVASVTDGSATQQLTVDSAPPLVTIGGGATVTTNDPTPTITGTTDADAGTIVHVAIGTQNRTTLVQADHTWDVTATTLADATRTVTASVSDAAGNEGSDTQSLIIDTAVPAATSAGGSPPLAPAAVAPPVIAPPASTSPLTTAAAESAVAPSGTRKLKRAALWIGTKVTAPPAGRVIATASGTVRIKGVKRAIKLNRVTRTVAAGGSATLKLRPKGAKRVSAAAFNRIKRAVKHGRLVTATIRVRLDDGRGTVHTVKRVVKLT